MSLLYAVMRYQNANVLSSITFSHLFRSAPWLPIIQADFNIDELDFRWRINNHKSLTVGDHGLVKR